MGTVLLMSTITAPNFQWSDLARRSGDVGEALDNFGEVTVVRGNQLLHLAPPLAHPIQEVLRDMCRLLTALVDSDDTSLVIRVLESAWPWTRALPADDQVALAREIGPIAEMCESLGNWTSLTNVVADWRRTARAWVDVDVTYRDIAVQIESVDGAKVVRPQP